MEVLSLPHEQKVSGRVLDIDKGHILVRREWLIYTASIQETQPNLDI